MSGIPDGPFIRNFLIDTAKLQYLSISSKFKQAKYCISSFTASFNCIFSKFMRILVEQVAPVDVPVDNLVLPLIEFVSEFLAIHEA